MCLAQGPQRSNAEPEAPWSPVKHSTTEPLRSIKNCQDGFTNVKDGSHPRFVYTRGVHLIVALGFCWVHYETYPYVIQSNWQMCSPLTETQFLVLKSML